MSPRSFRFFLPLFCFFPIFAASAQQPFRFVAIGDTGSGSQPQLRVADQMWSWMQQHPFKLVVMLGDNIYGNHEITGGGDPRYFHDKFDLQYERFQQQGVVFHATIGNHDMQTRHAQAEIDDVARFGMLGHDGYYKFSTPRQYDVHGRPLMEFFCLNSELHGEEREKEQAEWLARETSASKAIWKVVFLHHPLYTVRGQHAPAVELLKQIHATLAGNHVQIVLAGHNHFYARMKPVDGTMQIISGGGGRHLAFPFSDTCASVTARRYHFVGAEVYPDRILFSAIDQHGEMFDRATVDTDSLKMETAGCPKHVIAFPMGLGRIIPSW
ncbi:MAG TPA: metallophosphoesterase [Bryobacteraceae bacterium]|nr:metallophosphoesterase [Bryobacteraceae bacterium]